MNEWAKGTTGRVLFSHMSTTKADDPIKHIERKQQTQIFQLRVQHVALNGHLNKFNPEHPPMCPLCKAPYETVDHILFRCPNLLDIRRKLLPVNPTTENTLYGNHTQLERTSEYFSMALSRRVEAQRLD